MSVKLLIDSGADLPQEILDEYGIECIPITVYIDDVEYADEVRITPKEVFDAMRSGAAARTSQTSPHRFEQALTRLAENGDSVICMILSSGVSGIIVWLVPKMYPPSGDDNNEAVRCTAARTSSGVPLTITPCTSMPP